MTGVQTCALPIWGEARRVTEGDGVRRFAVADGRNMWVVVARLPIASETGGRLVGRLRGGSRGSQGRAAYKFHSR